MAGVLGLVGDAESPYAEERRAVEGAGRRRRQEFLTGRSCAHAALAAVGRDEGPIGVGPDRRPLWPPGVVGSIAHAGALAGAVVARAGDVWAVGFDLEPLDPPLPPEVERLVGARADPLDPYASKVAFSAKECVYKCLFPVTGRAFDFADVTVDLDPAAGRFSARVAAASVPGRFLVDHGYIFTGLALRTGEGVTG